MPLTRRDTAEKDALLEAQRGEGLDVNIFELGPYQKVNSPNSYASYFLLHAAGVRTDGSYEKFTPRQDDENMEVVRQPSQKLSHYVTYLIEHILDQSVSLVGLLICRA